MEYKYLIEKLTNRYTTLKELSNINFMYILCYYIEEQCKYPFLQFLMEKTPECDNILEEQLTLPYIILSNNVEFNNMPLEQIILEKTVTCLKQLKCDITLNTEMYKGIIYSNDGITSYALVNITGSQIECLKCELNSSYWFVLTSEIINTKSVYNIPIDKEVVKLFSDTPEIGILTNKYNINTFIIPDVVYTLNDKKTTEFISIFGNIRTQAYESCGKYYYFYRSYNDINIYLNDINNECGINRYALFVEGKLYMEKDIQMNLTDKIIDNIYPEPCINICFLKQDNQLNYDILVKTYESFKCISYSLDKLTK